MSNAVVTLKKGEGRALKQGGAWIFDNEIASILGAYENGDIVLVRDFDGYPMGRGFINEHSKIRIRMMTRNIDQEIDEAFLRKRVQDAWEYRKKVTDTSSCQNLLQQADDRHFHFVDTECQRLNDQHIGEFIHYESRQEVCLAKDQAAA